MNRQLIKGAVIALILLHNPKATGALGGVTVVPALQEVVLLQQEASTTIEVTVHNDSGVEQIFDVSILDFRALDETGGVAFVGLNATELEKKYGLAGWAKPDPAQLRLNAGQAQVVRVRIENQPNLRPGGHYGAVLVRQITSAGDSQVKLEQASASLVFMRKVGGEKESLELKDINFSRRWLGGIGPVELRFYNSGSVHLNPRGVVRLLDPMGKEVGRAAINESSGLILPESHRRYPATLAKTGERWLPGRYTMEVNYRYDGQEHFDRATASFYYLGSLGLAGAVAILLLMALAWWQRRHMMRWFTKIRGLRRRS
jgi:hypothetical protein